MVKAEKRYGNIAPIRRPAKMSAFFNEIEDWSSSSPELCKKPP
jgi:hypothetical protein